MIFATNFVLFTEMYVNIDQNFGQSSLSVTKVFFDVITGFRGAGQEYSPLI